MADLILPKDKTAVLVMDCQNDNTHEQGKMAPLDNGVMARLIKEKGTLRIIARLSAAARAAKVPVIQVRHGFRADKTDVPRNMRMLRALAKRDVFVEGTWGGEINGEVEPPAGYRDREVTHQLVLRQSPGGDPELAGNHPSGADRDCDRRGCSRHRLRRGRSRL